MRRFLIAAVLSSVSTAFGVTVTYTASGAWSGAGAGCAIAASTLTCANGSIGFTNIGATNVNTTIITDAESFAVTAPNGIGTGLGFAPAANFTLTINQTVPSLGAGGLGSAILGGRVFADSGSLIMQFMAPTSFNIGVVKYTLVNVQQVGTFSGVTCTAANPCMLLNGPSTGGGVTNLSLLLEGTTVPEPGSIGLIGFGLVALSLASRRLRSA